MITVNTVVLGNLLGYKPDSAGYDFLMGAD